MRDSSLVSSDAPRQTDLSVRFLLKAGSMVRGLFGLSSVSSVVSSTIEYYPAGPLDAAKKPEAAAAA